MNETQILITLSFATIYAIYCIWQNRETFKASPLWKLFGGE